MRKHYLLFALLITFINPSFSQEKKHRNVYAVVVGVQDYKNNSVIGDLNFADDDATAFKSFLSDKKYGAIPPENTTVLINEAASKKNIISAMRKAYSKAESNDLVIFFYSGHGGVGVICPYDYSGSSAYSLSYKEIKQELVNTKAAVKLCFFDACHSASFAEKGSKSNTLDTAAINKATRSLNTTKSETKDTTRLFVFTSSKKDETSIESATYNGGVFTYYLIKGLKGEADANRNKRITVSELQKYLYSSITDDNVQQPVTLGTNIALNTIVFSTR